MKAHLRLECKNVIIKCSECNTYGDENRGIYTREAFKKHTCRI